MLNLAGDGLPNKPGWYELKDGEFGDIIEVYMHPVKGLCCFSEDFGSGGSGVDDSCDCHVSVQCTGLNFIKRIGD